MQVDFGGLEVIQDWGWTPIQLAEKVDQFRERTIKGMTPECFGDREFFGELMFENPDGWKIIYDENRTILGFWQLLPLTEEGFQMAVHGQICADRIEDRIVPKLMPGNWHNGYFYSLSICPTIRRSLVAFGFGGTIIKSLINLAKKEIYYDHLTVCFATRYSQALNRTVFRFDYCSDHPYIGKMYRGRLSEFLNRKLIKLSVGQNMRDLIRVYQNAPQPLSGMASGF